ncbi:MAG: DJ-1/PfpI family protein [Cyclobacteriaceae bacterium]|nr:DJ-1/PfpI family protein [Cyclobacteriaceae bacterium HetDA_MAG_MS6]
MKVTVQIFLIFNWLFSLIGCKPTPSEVNRSQDSGNESIEITKENHDQIMDSWVGESKYNVNTLGILVYDGVNDLDFMGPRYILGQLWGVKAQLIAIKPGNIKTVMGVEVVPNTVIDSVGQVDILVIPGGFKGTVEGAYDHKLLTWIKKIDEKSIFTTSVCTGSWILGATGLLEGKDATTNWYRAEEMMEKYGAKFQRERYVRDGKYWTSAGVTAGLDMSLAIMNEIRGEDYTQAIMLDMEYDPAPPIIGGRPDNTNMNVYNMMLAMYDMGFQPLIDSLELSE